MKEFCETKGIYVDITQSRICAGSMDGVEFIPGRIECSNTFCDQNNCKVFKKYQKSGKQ